MRRQVRTIMDASGSSGKINTTEGKLISDVRKDSAGGSIRIGGDYLGQGDTATASNLFVDTYTLFYTDALKEGDAGRTIFWSDKDTIFKGNVYARGGAEGGNGGFVETSGHNNLIAQGYVDLTAWNGKKGTYFLGPTNITIYGNFDPSEIEDMKLWLDASDSSTILDTSGTAADSGSFNGDVKKWLDKSGNHNDAVATTTAGYSPDSINGHSAILIRPTGSGLETPAIDLSDDNKATVFFVSKRNGNSTGYHNLWIHAQGMTTSGLFMQIYANSTGPYINNYSVNPLDINSTVSFSSTPSITTALKDVASSSMYIDGKLIGTNEGTQALQNYKYFIGAWGTNVSNADIGEMIVFGTALDKTSIDLVNQYQSAKWGVRLQGNNVANEAVLAMHAETGYSAFTTRYLERLSQNADISLQASNDIIFDLKGDTLQLKEDRNLTLTAGNDIKSAADSIGTIVTSRTGTGGNNTMTAGNNIDLNNIGLSSGNGNINLNAVGNIWMNAINAGTGTVNASANNIYIKNYGLSVSADNLIAYYKLDEGSGTTAVDQSSSDNNGTFVNNPTYSSVTPPGVDNDEYSLSLNGTNYVSLASNPISGNQAFTLSGWIKTNTFGNYSGAISLGSSDTAQNAYIGTVAGAQVGTSNSYGGADEALFLNFRILLNPL